MHTSPCEYRILENGIHVFKIYEGSNRAANIVVGIFEKLYAETPPQELIRYILDLHLVRQFPINYGMEQMRLMARRYPHRALTRGAHIHTPSPMVGVFDMMLQMLIRYTADKARYFPHTQYDQAVAWVLAER